MSDDWNTIKENGPYIIVNEIMGYKNKAIKLTDLNTNGWESTPSINWYGDILTYSYSPVDQYHLKNYNQIRVAD